MTDVPALELAGVVKRYAGRTVVDGIEFRIAAGSVTALLGPNGAGKSTTMKMCAGFLGNDAGRIAIAGIDLAATRADALKRLTYLPENVVLYEELTGAENLHHLLGLATGTTLPRARLGAALANVGLPEEAHDRRAATYSKGMRQKVGLALALARESRLLLLDEPTSGLDPQSAAEFNTALAATAATGVGVLMATHDIWRAREVADRILVMAKGRIALDLDPAKLSAEEIERQFFLEAQAV
ncbi:MAG: ABC transporter ATP-binding protein [Alphaproteobacteria bacterium]|nr:MAG: ABC transporter ATP-binding protein [Alphaproteobacteria bacterium]